MNISQYKRKKTNQIFKILYVTIVLFALLTVATYTWFDLTFVPSVNDMSIYINASPGFLLSFENTDDEDSWAAQINFRDKISDDSKPLIPITYSKASDSFYTAGYGADGRIVGINQPVPEPIEEQSVANNGYYMKIAFYAKSGENVSVYLSDAIEVEEGKIGAGTWLIGAPVWDSSGVRHTNGGGGAETAMRVGIKITKLNSAGNAQGEQIFYLYEPNYDSHIDGSTGYQETPSIDGGLLADENVHILQTTSSWRDADLVQKNVVISQLGEFQEEPFLFDLAAEQVAKIELFFWLEGQDVDCGNLLTQKAMIMSNIQFRAETEGGSDLVPIR